MAKSGTDKARTPQAQGRCKPNRFDRSTLSWIATQRYGGLALPDNDAGRAMLLAMLACGLSVENAQKHEAPWIDPAELGELRRKAYKISVDDIGDLIRLTFEAWKQLKRCRFWPCDAAR